MSVSSLGTAYGLTFSSAIPIPEFPTALEEGRASDIVIELGRVDTSAAAGVHMIGPVSWASSTELVFEVPGVARYHISDGCRIVIEPCPGIDEANLRLFLLGSAIGALLLQRGLFLLHGCAVAIDGGACIAVGVSGAGKSTLAEGLRRRGFAVFADDVVAIDAHRRVLIGIPRIKLWQDAAEMFGLDPATLNPVSPDMAKYDIGITESMPMQPLPARWIYELNTHHGDDVAITRATGMDAFALLRRNSYRPRFADALGLKALHLQRAMEVASGTRLSKVRRPAGGFALDALAEAIENDVRS